MALLTLLPLPCRPPPREGRRTASIGTAAMWRMVADKVPLLRCWSTRALHPLVRAVCVVNACVFTPQDSQGVAAKRPGLQLRPRLAAAAAQQWLATTRRVTRASVDATAATWWYDAGEEEYEYGGGSNDGDGGWPPSTSGSNGGSSVSSSVSSNGSSNRGSSSGSNFARQVASVLQQLLGLQVTAEAVTGDGLFSIDLAVTWRGR